MWHRFMTMIYFLLSSNFAILGLIVYNGAIVYKLVVHVIIID